MLTLENITQTFTVDNKTITAIQEVTVSINEGEFFTIIGPSGCGKSTLLRIIANLSTPTKGNIHWEMEPKLGFVFQNYALFPFLTVWENIAFGLRMADVPRQEQKKIVQELVVEMGLVGFEDKHPKELSGGMKQRVGIARALAINPNVLLLDEPFSSLDEFTAESLRTLLLGIYHKRHMTVIMITHLIREAIELSDRIAVMASRPGTIETIIENTLPFPRDTRSQAFFELEDRLHELVKEA